MIRYFNLFFFAVMIVMNYLADALPLNGRTTGAISDSYPNLFVPAGVTFSIWGVIYLLLIVFCVVQFTSHQPEIINEVGWLFSATCILNALWIIAWHYNRLSFSLVIMLGLLAALIWININIEDMRFGLMKAAFGIYLGWICIATIANITAVLVSHGWNGFGLSDQTWTMIMIIVGALVTIAAIFRFNNPFIGLSVVWAFTGIMIKRQADYRTIFITAAIAMTVVAVVLILAFFRKRLPWFSVV
jgi:hypothetical protein